MICRTRCGHPAHHTHNDSAELLSKSTFFLAFVKKTIVYICLIFFSHQVILAYGIPAKRSSETSQPTNQKGHKHFVAMHLWIIFMFFASEISILIISCADFPLKSTFWPGPLIWCHPAKCSAAWQDLTRLDLMEFENLFDTQPFIPIQYSVVINMIDVTAL